MLGLYGATLLAANMHMKNLPQIYSYLVEIRLRIFRISCKFCQRQIFYGATLLVANMHIKFLPQICILILLKLDWQYLEYHINFAKDMISK